MNERIERIVNNLLIDKEGGGFENKSLEDRMKYYHTTALTFAVIDNYSIDSIYSCGVKEYGRDEKIDNDTPFVAASISKAVFAVAIMKLVQQGILDLDRDINEYLKDYQVSAEEGCSNQITLRQILGHLAGLNVDGCGGYELDEDIPTLDQVLNGEPPSKTEKVRVIRPQNTYVPRTLDNPTGPYSGGGYCIAQKAVCDVLNRDFADIMDDLVLKPFGMKNSTFRQPNEIEFTRMYNQKLPTGYNATRGGKQLSDYVPIRGGYRIQTHLAAAGLWSTAEDLAKFGVGLLNILKNDDDKTFSREFFMQMLVKQDNSQNGIGFYIHPTEDPDTIMFSHTGCLDGFMSMAYFFTNGQGFTMLFNSNEGMNLYIELPRAVSKEYGFPLSPENISFSKEDKDFMEIMQRIWQIRE
jgi:CubicO group peptidase (beta-lactamase class C family)